MAKPWILAGALPPPTGDQSSIMLHRRMPITQKLGEMTKVCCFIFQLALPQLGNIAVNGQTPLLRNRAKKASKTRKFFFIFAL